MAHIELSVLVHLFYRVHRQNVHVRGEAVLPGAVERVRLRHHGRDLHRDRRNLLDLPPAVPSGERRGESQVDCKQNRRGIWHGVTRAIACKHYNLQGSQASVALLIGSS